MRDERETLAGHNNVVGNEAHGPQAVPGVTIDLGPLWAQQIEQGLAALVTAGTVLADGAVQSRRLFRKLIGK